jgi:anti-anti-sigma regulatory factor
MTLANGRKLAKPRRRSARGSVMGAVPARGVATAAAAQPMAEAILRLGAQLTIREAVPLRAELLERADGSASLALDASGVVKVDTAGLQLLLAFLARRRAGGAPTVWAGCSDALRRAADCLDLSRALGLPAGIAP